MIIRSIDPGFQHPVSSEITPREAYMGRREWMQRMALGAGGAAMAAWASRDALAQGVARPGKLLPLPSVRSSVDGALAADKLTTYEHASTYNNFYEFGTDKSDPAAYAKTLKPRPWTVSVEGLVNKPRTMGIDDLMKLAPMEERIYRLRCVEGWSMVIPWVGFSLAELIRQVEPQGSAKYVEFVTLADRQTMPGVTSNVLLWPYVEGLRMDEARHPLTMLAFGIRPVQHRRPQSGHLGFVGQGDEFDILGIAGGLDPANQFGQWIADPRNHHRPALDAAQPVDPLLHRRQLEQVVDPEAARL